MGVKLTDQQVSELCAAMRSMEFLEKYREETDSIPGMKAEEENLKKVINTIWDAIDEDEQNRVLEEHKRQIVLVNKDIAKMKKKKEQQKKSLKDKK